METKQCKIINQCKIDHGIMPFWIDATKKKCEEIGFKILAERTIKL